EPAADRRRGCLRRRLDRRHGTVELPSAFRARVAAFALDLDRTLIAEDGVLRPRTREALVRTRAAGAHVVVVTGRMFRAVRPYLEQARLGALVGCYQGAGVAQPVVSKAGRLAFVADRHGFRPEETIACGDGENDRELRDWAGFGVAVANAHEDVLARADLVVPSVQQEGVAALLETYLDAVA